MNVIRLVALGTVVLIVGGCDGRDVLGPASSSANTAIAAGQVQTSGLFDANVDFSTLRLTPRGSNCLLQVNGQLVFTGTIEGVATGQTTALVFATCEEVASLPPGTDPDVFKSELEFVGTVDGQPAQAHVLYQGRVQPGGHIDGRLIFSNGVSGELNAEAQVAVGGSYDGSVVVH